jgi:AraC family transcriptional regulator
MARATLTLRSRSTSTQADSRQMITNRDAFPISSHGPRLNVGENFGAIASTVESGGLCINDALHPARMVVPRHEHANPYVCVVIEGCLEVRARDSVDCPSGSVIAYPAGHAHANRFGDRPGRCINVHFGSTWADESPIRDWLSDYRRARVDPQAASFVRLSKEMKTRDSAAPLAAASAAIELIAEILRVSVPVVAPIWLTRAIDIVEGDLANAPTLSALARDIGVHPAHLARIFRAARGESLGAYVRRRRIEEADRALATTDRPLAEIAAAAGFCDQAHFTRVYRRHFGSSPGARRRQRNAGTTRAPRVQDSRAVDS